ncbi:hypothetical protein WJU16_02720 [Chitinophaga pollutisoli]|uniref:Uncharacterized protein n=1 Tax=Chitinophaga pollutisoli TaxID=3133966 RepID=A0ABZ2YR60_9BACT
MANNLFNPIGYLTYDMRPKDSKISLAAETTIYSLAHADKLFEILSANEGNMVYANFKLLDLDRKQIVKEYKVVAQKKLKTPQRRITPPNKRGNKL